MNNLQNRFYRHLIRAGEAGDSSDVGIGEFPDKGEVIVMDDEWFDDISDDINIFNRSHEDEGYFEDFGDSNLYNYNNGNIDDNNDNDCRDDGYDDKTMSELNARFYKTSNDWKIRWLGDQEDELYLKTVRILIDNMFEVWLAAANKRWAVSQTMRLLYMARNITVSRLKAAEDALSEGRKDWAKLSIEAGCRS